MSGWFVYGHFEVGAPLINGEPEIRYVGGAYGRGPARPQSHLVGKCGCNPGCRPFVTEVLARGGTVAWKVLVVTEDDATTRAMETEKWEELRLAGHRVQPARPGYWNLTLEAIERHAAAVKESQSQPGERARNSARQKIAQNRPEVLAQNRSTNLRPEVHAKRSDAATSSWARPEVRERRINALEIAQNQPETNAKRSASLKSSWSQPDVHARRVASQKVAQNRPEVNARRSASLKATWARKKAGL